MNKLGVCLIVVGFGDIEVEVGLIKVVFCEMKVVGSR